jgi:formamidopyrimidine-DNA glycosylase
VALLDQKLVAGIGNLYASEILHRARIDPQRPAHRLGRAQIARLAAATRFVLEEAIRDEGSTLGDGTYRNALNEAGNYQNAHRVYDRAGERCPSCQRGTVRRIVQAQRSTFYCANCQR